MTIDELEADLAARTAYSSYLDLDEEEWEFVPDDPKVAELDINPEADDAQYGTAAYDVAYGMEEVALASGICPQCGEGVRLNAPLSMAAKDDTLFYDCTHSSNHKYLVENAHDPR